jgi:hypothetical protein
VPCAGDQHDRSKTGDIAPVPRFLFPRRLSSRLDDSNMDGSNWAAALVTAVFGTGGRGAPKAKNSTYTP